MAYSQSASPISTSAASRSLQVPLDLECPQNVLEASFNSDRQVEPLYGLMFDLSSRTKPLDILAMELDVHQASVTDWSIQLYTADDFVENVYNDPNAWTLLTETTMMPNPDSEYGAFIPLRDFKALSFKKNQYQALYVRLMGPWLDTTIKAFNQVAGTTYFTQDITLFPGIGVDTPDAFPMQLDLSRQARPLFAGRLHYRSLCDDVSASTTTTTEAEFLLLTNQGDTSSLFDKLQSSTEAVFATALQENDWLKQGVLNHNLQLQNDQSESTALRYQEACPNGWDQCQAIAITTKFVHDNTMSSDDLLQRLYQYTDLVTSEADVSAPLVAFEYIGLEPTVGFFEMVLDGVPPDAALMNEYQTDYLRKQTKAYLSARSTKDGPRVLDMVIEDQQVVIATDDNRRFLRQRHLQDGGSVGIVGHFPGLRMAAQGNPDYAFWAHALLQDTSFASDISFLTYFDDSSLATADNVAYFQNLNGITTTVRASNTEAPTVAPTVAPNENGGTDKSTGDQEKDGIVQALNEMDNAPWIYAGIGAVGCLILACLCLVGWCALGGPRPHKKKKKTKKKTASQIRASTTELSFTEGVGVEQAQRGRSQQAPGMSERSTSTPVTRSQDRSQQAPGVSERSTSTPSTRSRDRSQQAPGVSERSTSTPATRSQDRSQQAPDVSERSTSTPVTRSQDRSQQAPGVSERSTSTPVTRSSRSPRDQDSSQREYSERPLEGSLHGTSSKKTQRRKKKKGDASEREYSESILEGSVHETGVTKSPRRKKKSDASERDYSESVHEGSLNETARLKSPRRKKKSDRSYRDESESTVGIFEVSIDSGDAVEKSDPLKPKRSVERHDSEQDGLGA